MLRMRRSATVPLGMLWGERDVGDVLGDQPLRFRDEGGGAEVIDVVEADISSCFSHHFLGGWHCFAVVSGRGLTRRACFPQYIFTITNYKIFYTPWHLSPCVPIKSTPDSSP